MPPRRRAPVAAPESDDSPPRVPSPPPAPSVALDEAVSTLPGQGLAAGPNASAPSASGSAAPGPPGEVRIGTGSATPAPQPRTQSMMPRGRGASQKMIFRPVMPQRRPRQDPTVKQEPTDNVPSTAGPSRGRGRGDGLRGSDRGGRGGRGGGRGGGAAYAPVEMVATGPFAQGTGALSRADRSRSSGTRGAGPSWAGAPPGVSSGVVKPEGGRYRNPDEFKEKETYSEDEEGVEIVDMDEVHMLDELAPRALPRLKEKAKKAAKKEESKPKVDKEGRTKKGKEKATVKDDPEGADLEADESDAEVAPNEEARGADALDLSESETEETPDDLLADFVPASSDDEGDGPENHLYLFQFPGLFPSFAKPAATAAAVDLSSSPPKEKGKRSVAFAADVRGPTDEKKERAVVKTEEGEQRIEGQVGRLDVFKDGKVTLRFGEVQMEVTGGSQAAFLQELMVLDASSATATTLGELRRKFVVAPDVEEMLRDAAIGDREARERREREGMDEME